MYKPLLVVYKIDHLRVEILSSSLVLLNTSSVFCLSTSIRVEDSGLYLFSFLFTFLFLDLGLGVIMTITKCYIK